MSHPQRLARQWLLTLVASQLLSASCAMAQNFDGLKVYFCGTGGPLFNSGRNQPCTTVQAGDSLYLIDNGVGGWNTLRAEMGAPVLNLKAIFITHLHSDHIAGVGEAAEQSWINGREEALTFIGPEGVDKLAEDGMTILLPAGSDELTVSP